jgi:hypothetical protein
MRALHIHAGPAALQHLKVQGLAPHDVKVIPGAAGGPKGLILGPMDRFLFGEWLATSQHTVHLVGASIGAWRMATACLHQSVAAFQRLEHDYIHQHYELTPGESRPSAEQVSTEFGHNLALFYGGRIAEVLSHPRYRLHVVTSHGRHVLSRESAWATPLGYAVAYLANAIYRPALGAFLERVVFSSPAPDGSPSALPFGTQDFKTLHFALNEPNFMAAVQASCSIPFVLQAVHDVPGGPTGAYWDGGITDYHLHLDYRTQPGLVLYPHFQKQVVPGWLDKALKHRHRATPFLDRLVLLSPNPEWVASLPNGKLPDRTDFTRYGQDLNARVAVWQQCVSAAQQLADEWGEWLAKPDMSRVSPLT